MMTTAASDQQRQAVFLRLQQYVVFYDAEIVQHRQRIGDIQQALQLVPADDLNGARQRSLQVLHQSMKDAQQALRDAQLARQRLDMEMAQWA